MSKTARNGKKKKKKKKKKGERKREKEEGWKNGFVLERERETEEEK